jgi:hypothetical protein
VGTARHKGGGQRGPGADRLFAKAVELELPQALVRGLKPLGKIIDVLLIVLPLVGFPGFMEHGKVFYVQLFLVIFRKVPVLPANPLQPLCPLSISLVVNSNYKKDKIQPNTNKQ